MIDGNKAENAYLNGCRGGGVFLLQAHGITLRKLFVRNYNGDGISFQQCDTRIEECVVEATPAWSASGQRLRGPGAARQRLPRQRWRWHLLLPARLLLAVREHD